MRRIVLATLAAACICAASPLNGQVRWFKFAGNPVLQPGPAGTWDNSAARIDRVLFIGGGFGYYMWYTGYKGGVDAGPGIIPHIGHAISPDGITWWKDQANPVLAPTGGTWDAEGVLRPYVQQGQAGDPEFMMWYTGVGSFPPFRIGYAYWAGGGTWKKLESGSPVLAPGSGWESIGVEHPSVLAPDSSGGYRMWYQGLPGFRLGYATAQDETTWTRDPNGPITGILNAFYPRVLFNGQTYEMWYNIGSSQPADIGYATSADGIDWTPSAANPVFKRGMPGSWDGAGVLMGDIISGITDGGKFYHLWYAGSDGSAYRSGYAVSPRGFGLTVDPAGGPLDRNTDTVRVIVRGPVSAGLSYIADFESPNGVPVDTLVLFDDGAHGDSLSADGVFANSWVPGVLNSYSLDLKLQLHDTLTFEMADIVSFSPVVAVEDGSPVTPMGYLLEQNHPNPFNPTTVIKYQLPVPSDVKIVVYDLLGRDVAVLVNARMDAGHHEVRWDATGHPSGVYIYRMTANLHSTARKLIFMR